VKKFLLLFILLNSAYAAYIPNSFYTDDSKYYLKLNNDGFRQLVRINNNDCNTLESAYVIFKSNQQKVEFTKVNNPQSKGWPSIYGITKSNYCWLEAEVKNLDLNTPTKNQYAIEVNSNSETLYFQGLTNSVLPSKRFTKEITSWIQLGGHGVTPVNGGGHFFKLWEPVAQEVHLFTNGDRKFKLTPDQHDGDQRSHVIYLNTTEDINTYHYQFIKNGAYEQLEVANNNHLSPIKIDPMARELTYDAKGGRFNGYINPRAIIEKNSEYKWKYDFEINNLVYKRDESHIIYQLWPLAFNPKKVNGRYVPGTFNDITEKIDYLTELGVNTVEFLPIHESRFHGSWGYAMDSLLLIEKNLGESNELKSMVDKFHKENINVFFDVVINHINNDLLRDPLSATVSKTKFYGGNTGWGPKPRFSSVMVQKWITDSLLALQRDFHVDGYRFDMIEHVYHNSEHGYKFIQDLNTILKSENPNFHLSAEQLPDNVWVTFPIENGGLGFDTQWNDKFKNAFELEFNSYRENNRVYNPTPLIDSLLGYSDQGREHFGDPMRTVNYIGSHDFIANKDPILRLISGYISYEHVDHLHFYRVSPLSDPENTYERFRTIHNSFTHGFLKLAYGILFTKPGSMLFFQGEEMAQDLNLENEWSYLTPLMGNTTPSKNMDMHRYISSHRLHWEYLNPEASGRLVFLSDEERALFSGHTKFFKKLIKFKKENPLINTRDAYNVRTYFDNNLITYEIGSDDQHYFVVANFTNDLSGSWINFPGYSSEWWSEIYNSSSKEFGGKNQNFLNIISNVGGRKNVIRSKGPSITIFKKESTGKVNIPLYLRTDLSNWEVLPTNELLPISDREGNLYGTSLTVDKEQEIEFKIASSNWDIDLGASSAKDYISYKPSQGNVKVKLQKGTYTFIFNIRTFRYRFEKTR